MSHSTHQPSHDSAPPQYGQHGRPSMRNGLGTASLILGIIGAISGVIPLLFWMAGILGVIALILGLVGRGRVKRGEANNKGVTITGAVLGLVALVLSVVGLIITVSAVSDVADEIDKATSTTTTKDPGSSGKSKGKGKGKSKGGSGSDEAKVLEAGGTSVYKDDLKITVSAAKSYAPSEYAVGHTKGNKAYQLTVTVENAGTKKFDAALVTTDARAGAEGVTAEQIYDEKVGSSFTGNVLPGKKSTVTYAFDAPATAKTLTVEVTPGFMYDATQWELTL
ncbi:DUF4190 domain-containing protein [Streptomyces sp. NPDC020965]|uniref:DUF4190 domain-containing protein n=1 Tax=Streptomyces sp. NPDC020965 TaxID=3365105 RepID=UPI0037AC91EE